jgi:lysine 6-dehydrogenase
MKVAVLGAGGTIGPAIAWDLAVSDEVSELLLLDLDSAAAVAAAEAVGRGKARAASADATADPDEPQSLRRAIEGWDVLVNAASYRVNVHAMEACLEAGCHYLDLGGLYWMTSEQLERFAPPGGGDRFAAADLLALLGIGSSPGKTNLMAARAARELDDVHSLDVAAAGRDLDPPPGLSIPYALRTLIDEITLPPVVVRDGEVVEIEPLSDGGTVDFGEPIGPAETIHTLHSELRTFPESFGCRDVSFRLSLPGKLLEQLRELAAAPAGEAERAAIEAQPPSAHTLAVHLVEASGPARSVRVRALTRPISAGSARPIEQAGFGGGVVSTAAPAAAAVRLLARGRIESRGVLPPERCIDPGEMFGELERRGTQFEIQITEGVRA